MRDKFCVRQKYGGTKKTRCECHRLTISGIIPSDPKFSSHNCHLIIEKRNYGRQERELINIKF